MDTAIAKIERALPVTSMEELATAGELLARSGMFGIANAAAGFVVATTCHQQGISLMEFQRTYHIVEGKPSMRADAMLAEFRKRGGRCRIVENSVTRAAAEFEFEGQKVPFAYTMEDAQRKGDCYKGDGKTLKHTWQKRPEDMLWARLVSMAVRRLCPEINAGLYTPEEVADFDGAKPRSEPKTIDVQEAARRMDPAAQTPTEPEPDYTVCPLEGEVDGKSVAGMKWADMPNEWLFNALEVPSLPEEYKAVIRTLVPF